MRTALIAAGVLALSIGPALAATNGWNNSSQWNGAAPSEPFARHASNINQSDVRSDIAPALPKPSVGPDAGPAGYLRAAEHALQRNQTGLAQNSLEMAETRLLNGSVIRNPKAPPTNSRAIRCIDTALNDLSRHDLQGAEQQTRSAMPRIWQDNADGGRNGGNLNGGNWNGANANRGA